MAGSPGLGRLESWIPGGLIFPAAPIFRGSYIAAVILKIPVIIAQLL